MNPPTSRRSLTMAIHPNGKGVGWVAIARPLTLFCWGTMATRRKGKNGIYIRRIEKLFDRLNPHTLILEAFLPENSNRGERVASLCREIVDVAVRRAVDVQIYTCADVRRCFSAAARASRDDIAIMTAERFPTIAHLLPRRRRQWETERIRMALFSAAALTVAHYAAVGSPDRATR